jgi:histidinol-phosphate aminotransferase
MITRDDLRRFLHGLPGHVLTVVDEAYFEYVDEPAFPDAIMEASSRGYRVLALRTFSKIYGLAGLRVGYGVGPADVIAAIRKVQRAFDVATPGQVGALASLEGDAELARRRAANLDSIAELDRVLRAQGFDPVGPAAGNFLFVDVGADAAAVDDALLRRGVIVRPMGSFGAPSALRITAGTRGEIAFLAEQLASVLAAG